MKIESLVAFDDYLYIFGGHRYNTSDVNGVERYNPKNNQWTPVAPMDRRAAAAAAVFDRELSTGVTKSVGA